MMKKLVLVCFLCIGYFGFAQVGVGTEMPDPSAQLDVTVAAGDKGVLLARVALTSTTDQTTIANGNVESLLVYNTATQGNVTPGYYYWYDGRWRRLSALGDNEETITTLVDNGDGTYTYTSEDGTDTTFTSGGTMADNGDGTYTYTNPDGTLITIQGAPETLTTLEYDEDTGIISYTDEDGDTTQLDMSIAVDDWETLTNLQLNPDNVHLDYTDEDGVTHQIDLTALVQNLETLTAIVSNADGTFTYTDEDGNDTVVDINDLETLTTLALNADGKTLEYTDESGVLTTIDLEDIIANFETITTLVDNEDGTYTYTNENGDTTQIDTNTIETLTSIALNPDNVHIDYTDEEGSVTQINLTAAVQNLETVTSIISNADGTFTYTDEAGNDTVIDIGDTETLTALVLSDDVTTLTYTDEDGNDMVIDLEATVQANQKNVTLVDGVNTTVESTVSGNDTEWKVNVPTATGTTDTQPSTLGVVKEADNNPTVNIDEDGSLSVNLETINGIKEISGTYEVLPTDAVLLGNASSADVTIIMPLAENHKGKKFTIQKQDTNEDHYVNVYGNINGLSQLYTALPYSGWELTSDGTQWKITSKF